MNAIGTCRQTVRRGKGTGKKAPNPERVYSRPATEVYDRRVIPGGILDRTDRYLASPTVLSKEAADYLRTCGGDRT